MFLILLSLEDNKGEILILPGLNQLVNSADYIMAFSHLPKAYILSIEFDVPGPKIENCIKTNIF